jgi:hypothetical protein
MNPRLRMLVKMQQSAKVEITHTAHDQITEHALSRKKLKENTSQTYFSLLVVTQIPCDL